MALSDKRIEDLDRELIDMALKQFDDFCRITGVDKEQAFVCLEKKKGKSYGTIAQALGVSRQAVAERVKRCG